MGKQIVPVYIGSTLDIDINCENERSNWSDSCELVI